MALNCLELCYLIDFGKLNKQMKCQKLHGWGLLYQIVGHSGTYQYSFFFLKGCILIIVMGWASNQWLMADKIFWTMEWTTNFLLLVKFVLSCVKYDLPYFNWKQLVNMDQLKLTSLWYVFSVNRYNNSPASELI